MTHHPQHDAHTTEGTVLSGLVPTAPDLDSPQRDSSRFGRTVLATVPIILVGSMAVAMNLTGPIERVEAKSPSEHNADKTEDATIRDAGVPQAAVETPAADLSTAAATPSSYRVASGDTVSAIAGRFGVSTASILALNGLGWKSTIFPGQTLKLSNGAAPAAAPAPAPAAPAAGGRYTIVRGDTMGKIASKFGVTTQAILTANGLAWSSIIYPGQSIAIPGHTAAVPAAPAAPVKPAPVAAKPPASNPGSYVIQSGDNIGKIAGKLGVSMSALLSANGLTASSIIYAGRTLVVPGAATAPASTPAKPATPTAAPDAPVRLLTAEMEVNARTIISVGKELGVSDYGLVIALAAAMQESSLRNINYGHLDSVGLFQQRPSASWGSVEQLTNPRHAARLFFGGPTNPNKGVTRGLLEIKGWSSMTVTQAAQAVQISAFPDAYAKWEKSARFWLSDLR